MKNSVLLSDKAKEYIKAEPSENYDHLKNQFIALKNFINTQAELLNFYRNKDYATGEKRIQALTESLESEKDMNSKLTEEIAILYDRIYKLNQIINN